MEIDTLRIVPTYEVAIGLVLYVSQFSFLNSQFIMILHITTQHDWERAIEGGQYRGDTLDTEGFIHCSSPRQVVGAAEAHFQGRSGLVLLGIDPERVASPIRWEAINVDQQFPHIYGPLNVDAVVDVWQFEPRPDGTFVLPTEIKGYSDEKNSS